MSRQAKTGITGREIKQQSQNHQIEKKICLIIIKIEELITKTDYN